MIDCASGKLIRIPAKHYRLALHLCCRRNRLNGFRQRVYWCDECQGWHFTSRRQHICWPRRERTNDDNI